MDFLSSDHSADGIRHEPRDYHHNLGETRKISLEKRTGTTINIYERCPKDYDRNYFLLDNDAYFFEHITAGMLDETAKEVMLEIDKAVLLDENIGTIRTPLGITDMEHLSTGCKTILNYMYAGSRYEFINVTQCGANALEILFQVMETGEYPNRNIVLQHEDDVWDCGERDYIKHYRDGRIERITDLY